MLNKSQKTLHSVFTGISLSLIFLFAIWWLRPEHIANNFDNGFRIFDVLLFLGVTYIIWHPIIMQILTWSIAAHIKNRPQIKPKPGYKVAFVTTFVPGSESISLLHKTLPAMVNADYPHDTWILDEGNDPEVRALCMQLGVKHFSRFEIEEYNQVEGKFARRTKGGNHNSWYDAFGKEYDFVAQIDTDFPPKPNFLTATLGYFEDEKVAFVGTPQVYGNVDKSIIAKGAAEQTYSFYGSIMRGLDGMDTANLIGANHVLRVKALESVNHYSAHITEDLLTGMKLHADGWKSVYVPEVLAVGEGPSTWKAFFDQQRRWAYGCMHILFKHSPRLFKDMTIRRSAYYLMLQQHYFSGVAMALSTFYLVVYFVFGINSADMNLGFFLGLYLPVLLAMILMDFWLQRFNIRPKEERGIFWAGMYVNLAVWPIFFLAFLNLFKRKKLVYKVTPKGVKTRSRPEASWKLFVPHYLISFAIFGVATYGVLTGRLDPLMLFWAAVTFCLMVLVPILIPSIMIIGALLKKIGQYAVSVNQHNKFFEFKTEDRGLLPKPPTIKEKWLYSQRRVKFLMLFSIIGFVCVNISMVNFLIVNPAMWILFTLFLVSLTHFGLSLFINLFTKDFDIKKHMKLVRSWKPMYYPSVDIFLPTAGEPIAVLRNTWMGVQAMVNEYQGKVTVYSLDDGASDDVKKMAKEFNFVYEVRENRGYFKKAGNLRHGYGISKGEFIVIFDADFVPRKDFLAETLPYFIDRRIGIVQSPQYFDVHGDQNWLERGAGAVQELFYRFSQVSSQHHGSSICVGSNAVYRRRALDDTGGTALIEHSEDVHTGFDMRLYGWQLQYIPIILAKGLCPADMRAFFKQQYRWCMGSLSLLTARKFWEADLKPKSRMPYLGGFMYYIHTGVTSLYTPIIPLFLLFVLPDQISLINYLLILPAFIFTQIIYPLWHKSTYGIEAWSTRQVYGWAHLFAIWDKLTNNQMSWVPTGDRKKRKETRYVTFRILQVLFNFIPALIWVSLAGYYAVTESFVAYFPILLSGIYFLMVSSKVTFYTTHKIVVNTDAIKREISGQVMNKAS